MSENLLQFIWLHRFYNSQTVLQTIEGEKIIVIHPGILNTNAGPDFLEAQLKIGETLWAGNIEIHIKSSDWNKHHHHTDIKYSKLILHVVYEYDAPIETLNQTIFPTLELKNAINLDLLQRYEKLLSSKKFIACENVISQVKPLTVQQQLSRMLAERLEEKTYHIADMLHKFNNDWHHVFYIQLARGFGLHINQDAFEQLALHTPLNLLAKHKHNCLQIEALLFGQAGFLFDYFDEDYPILLQKEYAYLSKLYNLQAIDKYHWKFLRLRPANFPTLRIAQFASLVVDSNQLLSKIFEVNSIKEIYQLFNIRVSNYWLNHYNFQEKSIFRNKSLGTSFVSTLIINAIIPTLFIYGKLQGRDEYCNKAIRFLEEINPESNSIIQAWSDLGIPIQSAADSQALLQLKNKYCDYKRCLECSIGYSILKI